MKLNGKNDDKESEYIMRKDIVFIIDDIYNGGGIARVTLFLISNLIKTEQYNISLISMSKSSGSSYYEIPKQCKVINLSIHTFAIRKHFLKAAHELRHLYASDFAGTFVINDVGHNIPAWIGLRHCKKAKFISWSHMNFFNGSKYGFSGVGKRLGVKKFDYVVALTKEDQSYYQRILNAHNVVQIYNPKNSGVVRQKYDSQVRKIISCGRLNRIKGFDMLIDVASKVFEQVEDWQWDIYGEGPEEACLKTKIQEAGLTGKVNLMGYRSDILNIYKDYSFCVFTSRGEGCPMAMIEAQSAGLPMISFDFKCGPKDLITDGKNGFIIKNWDLNKMAECILHLIRNRDLRIKFAENSDMNLKELEIPYVLNQWEKIL